MKSTKINVSLPTNSYSIDIHNSWKQLKKSIDPFLGPSTMVVTDSNLAPIYGREIINLLESTGAKVIFAEIPVGESSKTLDMAYRLYTKALEGNLNRSSSIIAIGGGVIGDLAGFVASTYMRGVNFIQIPTTLLAQVDSSVGGKVAVNHPLAKNIIGSFYQPKSVYINTSTLKTLPSRQFATGMAELIKYGFIWDRNFIAWLLENIKSIMAMKEWALSYAIKRCCQIKAEVVGIDEKEQGLRAILNFGHTIGHGLESITDYKKFTHGEAVSLGMVYESKIAHRLGLIHKENINLLVELLKGANLPTYAQGIDVDALIKAMTYDKKNKDGSIVFVLPIAKGQVNIFDNIDNSIIYEVFGL